jgi:hypothetical protein
MLRKLLLVALVALIGISTASAQFNKAEQQFLRTAYRVRVDGDAFKSSRIDGKTNLYGLPSLSEFVKKFNTTSYKSVSTITTTAVFTTGTTEQDYASNSSPQQIWQDPNNPNNIHAINMTQPTGLRVSAYYFSSDKGATWSYIGDVPAVRSGYPSIDGFSDGTALITTHTTDGGTNARSQVYKDLNPGLGSFTRFDEPTNDIVAANIWGRVVATSNTTLANKFILTGSVSGGTGAQYTVCTGIGSTPGTWLGWTIFDPNAATAEKYPVARGADGRIGLAWLDATTDVWFCESTNNGTSFSTPIKIFTPVFDPVSLEGYGPITGISLAYKGNTPVCTFEGQLENATGYYPGLPAKVFFWSNTLPGVDPNRCVVVVDSSKVPYFPYVGINYNDGTITHPNIGVSSDGNVLFVGFVAASPNVDATDSTSDCDIWLAASADGGLTWPQVGKISPTAPVKDWRYVSVSRWNDMIGTDYYCNMTAIRGNIAGSYVGGAPISVEELWSLRSKVTFVSVTPISSEVPANYSLSQNFPNPFNPTTNIKFGLVKAGFVSLKVYDLAGKEVSSLVNEKLSVGTYQYNFNASNLSSGIYFYTLRTEGFTETKKMMLIK